MLKKIKFLILLVVALSCGSAWARLPYYPIELSRDEAAHFKNVPYQGQFNKMMEWWYFNGTLVSTRGGKLGYYVSFNYMYEPKTQIMVPFIQIQITDVGHQKVYAKQLFLLNPKDYSISTSTLDIHVGKTFSLIKRKGTYFLEGQIPSAQGVMMDFALQLTQKPEPDVASLVKE